MKKSLVPIYIIAILVIGFFAGSAYQKQESVAPLFGKIINSTFAQQSNPVDFSLFWTTWDVLHEKFVDKDKLKTQDLIYGAIEGMIAKAGDPYTVFFTPKEAESFAQEISGAFAGIGIEIGTKDGVPVVVSPINGTPAYKAGMKAGDRIIKIDNKSTEGMKLPEAVNLIRGQQGTPVKITYIREDAKPVEVTIIRDVIKIPAVEWSMIGSDIAHLKVFSFNKNVNEEFRKASEEIRSSSAKSIILDLRGNPGGLLESSIYLTDFFTEPNSIVTIEKFSNGLEQEYRTQGNGLLKSYPVIILLDGGSASASEILAGALRDNRKFVIVGVKSFGKGSVQEVVELPKGASLKVTIAKWFTPKGASINDAGISPDIEVKLSPEDIKKFEEAIKGKNKDEIKALAPEFDPQLKKAIDILRIKR